MPDPNLIAEVVCNGARYTQWETISVRRDYGTQSVTVFQFTAAELSGGAAATGFANLKLNTGDPVQVYLGGVKVADGYITIRETEYDEKSHNLVIIGRGKALDLVDSSLPIKQGSLSGYTFQQAVNYAVQGTNVNVVIQNPPPIISKPFRNLMVQYGETRFEFIERLTRMRGLMITDDADGNLVCSQADPSANMVAELQEGVNILRARCRLDDESAWSTLSASGQYSDPNASTPPRANSATVQQSGVTRPGRARIIVAEHPGDAEDMQQRAAYENARSFWPVINCAVTVVGWQRPDGQLWNVADSVTVLSPMLFPNETGSKQLGIQSTTFAQDSTNGSTTILELVLPQALTTIQRPGVQTGPDGSIINGPSSPAQIDAPDNGITPNGS